MRIKSFVLIEKDQRYLLIQESNRKWNGKWFFPGGTIEFNETPEMAAIRETKEETGCDAMIDGLIYMRYYTNFFNRKIILFYKATLTNDVLKTFPDQHSLQVKWFTYEEILRLPLRQKMLEVIDEYRKTKRYLPVDSFKIIEN